MIIFNNGKYKSLHAAQAGELESIKNTVENDRNFRPVYHLAAPTGLLNDPNGLIWDGEKYHVFYQWFPFGALHGMKHWKHYTTTDFIHYRQAQDLIPDELFESHGCYSGGALLAGDKIACFYTGNTRRPSDNQRVPFQNLALFDKAGNLLGKRPLLKNSPAGYTEHFRDPKPFFASDGKIRFICGAQRENMSGTALLFEMENLEDKPQLLGELQLPAFNNQNVFMWECPDLLKIDNRDLFIWSPQGKIRESYRFQNNYHAAYALGRLDGLTFQAERIAELDQGFDFYAPQTFANTAARTILLAWIGLPDLTYPTDKYKWHSMITLPRELRVENNRLYQQPVREIYQNLTALESVSLTGKAEIHNLDRAYLKFNAENQPFRLNFFTNAKQQNLTLSYDGNLLCLDRSQTEQTDEMKKFGAQRYCEIENLQQVEIFFDRSVCEIFLNRGEKTMTSRFFMENRQNVVEIDRTLHIAIGYPRIIDVK
ncbi:fructosidase [Actinobacillus succinogenes]|uniref:Sucrose-6-phosphate hydrolase n=1 Tax=Actinobacillus succinogenes (strain ATCC 55618 / DSM 22257 / CCUG 43843 / 130Z) TaxID=339671 RepID=A6VQD3_ACTSZ|nr:glycoside hydrolase family 32 protein [Actinobacillus succinogenes]ABR75180.1 sucrose-6-phosphate hydrolase [Actinobacillus succinogenes 130Z]PHI40425.1 fructosidase [Actinobacillus succinogenes]